MDAIRIHEQIDEILSAHRCTRSQAEATAWSATQLLIDEDSVRELPYLLDRADPAIVEAIAQFLRKSKEKYAFHFATPFGKTQEGAIRSCEEQEWDVAHPRGGSMQYEDFESLARELPSLYERMWLLFCEWAELPDQNTTRAYFDYYALEDEAKTIVFEQWKVCDNCDCIRFPDSIRFFQLDSNFFLEWDCAACRYPGIRRLDEIIESRQSVRTPPQRKASKRYRRMHRSNWSDD